MIKNLRPFHLAIPVSDLKKAKEFYTNLLECSIGRSSNTWIDLNFYGHQLVIHLSNISQSQKTLCNLNSDNQSLFLS